MEFLTFVTYSKKILETSKDAGPRPSFFKSQLGLDEDVEPTELSEEEERNFEQSIDYFIIEESEHTEVIEESEQTEFERKSDSTTKQS